MSELEMRESSIEWEAIDKNTRKQKIRTTAPNLSFTFHADDLRSKIKEFAREPLADTECFATTLNLVEALSDTGTEARRARAWATADLQSLEQLLQLPVPYVPCAMAVLGSQVAKEIIPSDVREQL